MFIFIVDFGWPSVYLVEIGFVVFILLDFSFENGILFLEFFNDFQINYCLLLEFRGLISCNVLFRLEVGGDVTLVQLIDPQLSDDILLMLIREDLGVWLEGVHDGGFLLGLNL